MPKQITLEEIVKLFLDNFYSTTHAVKGSVLQLTFDQKNAISDFITTYFTQFAEGLRLEEIGEDRFGSMQNPSIAWDEGHNQAKTTLDEKINKALGKE